MKYKLKDKSNIVFTYEQNNSDYTNKEGFNNSVGVKKPELFLIPFWILHFKFYRLFHWKGGAT